MPLVERNGVELHVQELGDAGPPVVMVHGAWIDTMSSWYFTVAPTVAAAHRVLLYDLRGHGMSARPRTGYGLRSMAGDLEAVVEAFTDEPVSLVGWSYGSAVVLRYALDHPGRVDRIVAVETPLPVLDSEELTWFFSRSPEEWVGMLPDDLRWRYTGESRRVRRVQEQARALVEDTDAIAEVLAEPDIADAELATLTCPVLLCYGSETFLGAARDRLAAVLPDARLQTLPGWHVLPLECPGELAESISGFLDG